MLNSNHFSQTNANSEYLMTGAGSSNSAYQNSQSQQLLHPKKSTTFN